MNIKKLIICLVTGIIGFLLLLSGVSLINISSQLVLYSGVALLVLAAVSFFLL